MNQNRRNNKFAGEPEIFSKVISLRRVVKVVKGGRRFAFSALVVVGDKAGKVGYGTGKAREVASAIGKAISKAKKSMIRVPLRGGKTLHHDIEVKYRSTRAILRSAPPGCGLIAGGAGRHVFELLGIQDMVAKFIGSTQEHSVIMASLHALSKISSPRQFADRCNRRVIDIVRRRDGHSNEYINDKDENFDKKESKSSVNKVNNTDN